MEIVAAVLFTLFFAVGLVGLIAPVLPGVPLVAVGAVLAAWLTGFERLGWLELAWVIGLAVLAQVIDYLAGLIGASRFGASRAGLWGSVIGALVGVVFFPPWGFLTGALVGAIVAELIAGRELIAAVRSGIGALLGTLGGVVAKLFIVIAMGIIVFPRVF
jgi:uncharacterized protein YqgC (DUF456 family)